MRQNEGWGKCFYGTKICGYIQAHFRLMARSILHYSLVGLNLRQKNSWAVPIHRL